MKQRKFYLIYKITNNLNQKFYIGKHKTDNLDDNYFGSGKHLKNAQEKYGLENFTKTILFYCANEKEMNLLEKTVVTPEFCNRDDVYNINEGGEGGWNYVNDTIDINYRNELIRIGMQNIPADVRSEQIEKQRTASKRYWKKFGHNWLGRHHSDKTKKKMSKSHKGKITGKLNPMFGKMWICNDLTKESKTILKTDPIPNGWRKGRICKK